MLKNTIKKAALYIRVSTDMQADKDSLPLQESDLRKLADLNGITETVLFKDAGFSGKNFNRPAFQDMLTRIRQGEFTHLYVWKLDRISRNLIDFIGLYDELKKLGVVFVSKNETFDTSSAFGEAMLKILLVFAEMERKTTAERVAAVMVGRAKEGKWNGSQLPYGYMLDNSNGKAWPIPDPIEAPIVKMIFETYAKDKSLEKIAYMLNNAGIRTKRGKSWTSPTISTLMKNEFYKGIYFYNRRIAEDVNRRTMKHKTEWIRVEGKHTPLVTAELWDQCEKIRNSNRSYIPKKGQRINAQEKYLFGGLLVCSGCGYTLPIAIHQKQKLHKYPSISYACQSRYRAERHCTSNSHTTDIKLLPILLGLVARIMLACSRADEFANYEQLQIFLLADNLIPGAKGIVEIKDIYTTIRGHVKHLYTVDNKEAENPNAILIASTEKELASIEKALERLKNAYLFDAGDMSEAEYFIEKKKLNTKAAKLKNQLAALSDNKNIDEVYLAQLSQLIFIKKLQNTFNTFGYYEIVDTIGLKVVRDFITSIIEKVYFDHEFIVKIVFKNGQIITMSR